MEAERNQALLNVLQPGDLVEITRQNYEHWAVYVGNCQVVHLTGAGGSCHLSSASVSGDTWVEIKLENLWDVVNNSVARRNNILDGSHRPRAPAEIVRTALSYVGSWINYSLLFRNCEHFATWCRYGVSRSWQVTKLLSVTSVAAAAGFILFRLLRS